MSRDEDDGFGYFRDPARKKKHDALPDMKTLFPNAKILEMVKTLFPDKKERFTFDFYAFRKVLNMILLQFIVVASSFWDEKQHRANGNTYANLNRQQITGLVEESEIAADLRQVYFDDDEPMIFEEDSFIEALNTILNIWYPHLAGFSTSDPALWPILQGAFELTARTFIEEVAEIRSLQRSKKKKVDAKDLHFVWFMPKSKGRFTEEWKPLFQSYYDFYEFVKPIKNPKKIKKEPARGLKLKEEEYKQIFQAQRPLRHLNRNRPNVKNCKAVYGILKNKVVCVLKLSHCTKTRWNIQSVIKIDEPATLNKRQCRGYPWCILPPRFPDPTSLF